MNGIQVKICPEGHRNDPALMLCRVCFADLPDTTPVFESPNSEVNGNISDIACGEECDRNDGSDFLLAAGSEPNHLLTIHDQPAPGEDARGLVEFSDHPLPGGKAGPAHGGCLHSLGLVPPGTLIAGNCRVVETLRAHETERAGVFVCDAPEGKVVVKILAATHTPKTDLWRRLVALKHPNVVRVYRTEQHKSFSCEVLEYCDGGTLAEYIPKPGKKGDPHWLMQKVIPQLASGIAYLHEQGIVHRDLTPYNILLKGTSGGRELIITDFDISSELSVDTFRRGTSLIGGNWEYTAPDALPIPIDDWADNSEIEISRSADYYSLGVTLKKLITGSTELGGGGLSEVVRFYRDPRRGRIQVPNEVPAELATLMRGLLTRNCAERWGAAEIARWIAGQTTSSDRARADSYDQWAPGINPYKSLGNPRTLEQLAQAALDVPEGVLRHLRELPTLTEWIARCDPEVALAIQDDLKRYPKSDGLLLHSFVLRCAPSSPFTFFPGYQAETPEEWPDVAERVLRDCPLGIDTLVGDDGLEKLEVWLRLREHPEPELADAVTRVKHTELRLRLEELSYLLQPSRALALLEDTFVQNPSELPTCVYGQAVDWDGDTVPPIYEAGLLRWLDGSLSAWLRQRGHQRTAAIADHLRKGSPSRVFFAFESLLRHLDADLPSVAVHIAGLPRSEDCMIPFGTRKRYTVAWQTSGPGMPGVVLEVPDQSGAVSFVGGAPCILTRRGSVQLELDSRWMRPAGASLTSGLIGSRIGAATDCTLLYTQLYGDRIENISYCSVMPDEYTAFRVMLGVVAGAALFGTPRWLMSAFGLHHSFQFVEFTAHLSALLRDQGQSYWGSGNQGLLGVFPISLAALYTGYRLWSYILGTHSALLNDNAAETNTKIHPAKLLTLQVWRDLAARVLVARSVLHRGMATFRDSISGEARWRRHSSASDLTDWDALLILLICSCVLSVVIKILIIGLHCASLTAITVLDELMSAAVVSRKPGLAWSYWGAVYGGAFALWTVAPFHGVSKRRSLIIVIPITLMLALFFVRLAVIGALHT